MQAGAVAISISGGVFSLRPHKSWVGLAALVELEQRSFEPIKIPLMNLEQLLEGVQAVADEARTARLALQSHSNFNVLLNVPASQCDVRPRFPPTLL